MTRQPFVVSGAVASALAEGRGVVALETSVLAQGLPKPRNVETAEAMSEAIRRAGAEPAWIAVVAGSLTVGVEREDLTRLATEADLAPKVARRDLGPAAARGGWGATTVSAALWAAHRAGIHVAATGGIGGVHPGSNDVSADLLEMARTPLTLVCSGPKSIVDPHATMERLDELGVPVMGYRCSRLPFFLAMETDIELEHRADSAAEVAAAARVMRELGMDTTLLVANPVPEEDALDPAEVSRAAASCLAQAEAERITGKGLTPFLLGCLVEETGGRSLDTNIALLASNAALAAEIAAEFSKVS